MREQYMITKDRNGDIEINREIVSRKNIEEVLKETQKIEIKIGDLQKKIEKASTKEIRETLEKEQLLELISKYEMDFIKYDLLIKTDMSNKKNKEKLKALTLSTSSLEIKKPRDVNESIKTKLIKCIEEFLYRSNRREMERAFEKIN